MELPAFAPGEIVTLALSDADLSTLLARGYRVLEERAVPDVGTISRRLAVPEGVYFEAARSEVRGLASGTDADFNHYYRSEQSPEPETCEGGHCAALQQIGWSSLDAATACTAEVTISVVDTGINPITRPLPRRSWTFTG